MDINEVVKNTEDTYKKVKTFVPLNSSPDQSQVKFNPKTPEGKAFKDLTERFAKALEQGGLNVADHIMANAIYYNKSGLNYADPPQTGRTFVFITRPDLNFARANINSESYFDMLYESAMGHIIFPMLTHPHRYINHEYTTDDFPKMDKFTTEFWKLVTDAQNNAGGLGADVEDKDIADINDADLVNSQIDDLASKYNDQNKNGQISKWDQANGEIKKMKNEYGNDQEYNFKLNIEPKYSNLDSPFVQSARDIPIAFSTQQTSAKTHYVTKNFQTPFIPLLMNHCTEVSAGKDMVLAIKEMEGDYFGGRLAYAAGADEMNSGGEISLSFTDNYYRMIYTAISVWVRYINGVARGYLMPRISNIWEKIIDYTCSIYVFVTDKDFSTLVGWAKYTGCFPVSISTGAITHSTRGDLNSNWQQLQVPFRYNHVEYMTPEIITDFNYVAGTEYERQLKKNFKGYSLFNSQVKKYSPSDLFESIGNSNSTIKLGVSGKAPDRVLKFTSSGEIVRRTNSNNSLDETEENRILNETMPFGEAITMNKHWDGFPMIVSNRLIWVHKSKHPRSKLDDDSGDYISSEFKRDISDIALSGDPEATEASESSTSTSL